MNLKNCIEAASKKRGKKLKNTEIADFLCKELHTPGARDNFINLLWRLMNYRTFAIDYRIVPPLCKILECTPDDLFKIDKRLTFNRNCHYDPPKKPQKPQVATRVRLKKDRDYLIPLPSFLPDELKEKFK